MNIPKVGDAIWLPGGKHKVRHVKEGYSLNPLVREKIHYIWVEGSPWDFEWEYIAKFQEQFQEHFERQNCSTCFDGFMPLYNCPIHKR